METITMLTKLVSLLEGMLVSNSPVMSGNMQSHISYHQDSKTKYTITISAPTYDLAKWRQSGMVIYDGKGNYALSVNKLGAFNGKSRKSQHWVDKTIEQVVRTFAGMYQAEVIKK